MRPSQPTARYLDQLNERDWQAQVTEAAELYGWTWAHFRPAQTARGWRTPVSGPLGAGWPDLILVRRDRLVLAELKAERGTLTAAQRMVHLALAPAAELYVWRPSDLPLVLDVLR